MNPADRFTPPGAPHPRPENRSDGGPPEPPIVRIFSPRSDDRASRWMRRLPQEALLRLQAEQEARLREQCLLGRGPFPETGPPPIPHMLTQALERAFDPELFRQRLKTMRRDALERLEDLCQTFVERLRSQGHVAIFQAATAEAACDYIRRSAGETPYAATNRSGTVNNELAPGLKARGFTLIETYYHQFHRATGKRFFWQLDRTDARWIAAALEQETRFREFSETPRDAVGVLGVSAAAAADGSLYFLQHFDNITEILALARQVFFIVPLEKVVPGPKDAALQVQAMGVYGFETVPLELVPQETCPLRLEDLPEASLSPGEVRFHVILLDHGRRRMLKTPLRELALCIACRACLNQCPSYRYFGTETRRNPREYVAGFVQGLHRELDLCLLCNRCRLQCPVDIDLPRFIRNQQQEQTRRQGLSRADRLLSRVDTLSRWGSRHAPLANALLTHPWARWAGEKLFGIDRRRHLHPFAPESFSRWIRRQRLSGAVNVVYFSGCFANYYDTEVGKALVEVLERNRCRVVFPQEQVCCGRPKMNGRREDLARRNARINVGVLVAWVRRGYSVVTSCPSCGLSLKKDYVDLLGTEEAREVARHTYNIAQFLLILHETEQLDTAFRELPLRVGYHAPCYLRAQGLEDAYPRLLGLIPGMDIVPVHKGCSGMGGLFGFKASVFEKSMEMGAALFAAAGDPGLQRFATDCGPCKMHIRQGSGRDVVHPLLILRDAYRNTT